GDVLRHYRLPFVDLNHDEPKRLLNLGRLTKLDYLYLSRTAATADVLISLPKLKTHHWAGATLSLKNLFGTLPGVCYGWPKNELHWRGIDNSIVDIALTRTPDLAIVDGIVGMEGDGPLNGTPKEMGTVVMGSDLLAVLREAEVQQLGETIQEVAQPFATVPHFHGICVGRSAGSRERLSQRGAHTSPTRQRGALAGASGLCAPQRLPPPVGSAGAGH